MVLTVLSRLLLTLGLLNSGVKFPPTGVRGFSLPTGVLFFSCSTKEANVATEREEWLEKRLKFLESEMEHKMDDLIIAGS